MAGVETSISFEIKIFRFLCSKKIFLHNLCAVFFILLIFNSTKKLAQNTIKVKKFIFINIF